MAYLHGNSVVHRDIKAANIFETVDGVYKIGDLNLSKVFEQGCFTRTQVGTPNYASPEIWRNEQYGTQSDIWSLGVLTFELAAQKCPFEAPTAKELHQKITKSTEVPRLPSTFSPFLYTTVKSMLLQDPLLRPDASQLVSTCLSVISPLYESVSLQSISGEFQLIDTIILPNTRTRWNSLLPKLRLPRSKTDRGLSLDRLKINFIKTEEESTRELENSSICVEDQTKKMQPVLPLPSRRQPKKGAAGRAFLKPRLAWRFK